MPFTSEDAKNLLEKAYEAGPDRWMAAVNTLLVDLFTQHGETRHVVKKLALDNKKFATVFDVLQAQLAGQPAQEQPQAQEVAQTAPQERLGADGGPLSVEQAAVENMMDQATAGAEEQAAPQTIAQRLRVPPKGGPRNGNGGHAPAASGGVAAPAAGAPSIQLAGDPQSDDNQAKVEEMMNSVFGPRQ